MTVGRGLPLVVCDGRCTGGTVLHVLVRLWWEYQRVGERDEVAGDVGGDRAVVRSALLLAI